MQCNWWGQAKRRSYRDNRAEIGSSAGATRYAEFGKFLVSS
jgi:hypothetical protein